MRNNILCQYVRVLADEFGLRDWTFVIEDELPKEGNNVEIAPAYARRWAAVRVSPAFERLSEYEQRHGVVHELIHCHLSLLQESFLLAVKGRRAAILRMNLELGVDALADGCACKMPLPGEIIDASFHGQGKK